VPKSKRDWRPTASLDTLIARAHLFEDIRDFFKEKKVLALETPLLGAYTGTDPCLESFQIYAQGKRVGYLQTSPEFSMKRFLAAYPEQPIYQITRAFRAEEEGRWHHPEFTILEWYRPGWTLAMLQEEVQELLHRVLGVSEGERVTYAHLFQTHYGFCPHTVSQTQLESTVLSEGGEGLSLSDGRRRDDCLDFLISHGIEPRLGLERPVFVYDYPASQAALAKVKGDPPVAARFECYYQGRELANAYDEVVDAEEQRKRFAQDNHLRETLGLDRVEPDPFLLAALDSLPKGVGIALGVDRLCCLALGLEDLSEVLSFRY
jgi:elongation factor P--(R)-beta-lysine ligase